MLGSAGPIYPRSYPTWHLNVRVPIKVVGLYRSLAKLGRIRVRKVLPHVVPGDLRTRLSLVMKRGVEAGVLQVGAEGVFDHAQGGDLVLQLLRAAA